MNPSPAVFTGQFSGTIGVDTAQPNGGGIQLTAGAFQSCTINFDTATVNQTSTMILILNPTNQLSTSSYIVVTLPQTRRWTNDISTSNTLPLSTSMTCSNITNTNLPTCTGDLSAYTLTARSLFPSATTDSFSFGVTNFQSPPTPQPSDLITITSY